MPFFTYSRPAREPSKSQSPEKYENFSTGVRNGERGLDHKGGGGGEGWGEGGFGWTTTVNSRDKKCGFTHLYGPLGALQYRPAPFDAQNNRRPLLRLRTIAGPMCPTRFGEGCQRH